MTDGCRPIFSMRPIEDKAASANAGRPIFVEREYVEIIIPGSRNERPVRRVNAQDKERWAAEYERFSAKRSEPVVGTPLEQWPRMTRTRVFELRALGVDSVEDLAGLTDNNLANIGPDARALRDAAKSFINGAGEIEALRERIDALETENEKLKRRRKGNGHNP